MLRQFSRQFSSSANGGEKLFDKILVANRGEIACRVMKTAKSLGIKTVAVYSEPDAKAMHVKMADEAYCIGPAASAESYLNVDKIMQVIQDTGAQAVHPGYGFLSENHLFAEALEAKGVSFIGPGSFAITAMGDKIGSKKIAMEAGVNTIPGDLHVVTTDEEIKRIANEIGYPVMIKASAGGGGKGMRIAWNDEEAIEGFKLSTEEARKSFGDDRMFIEKFVVEPRHIEIQLIADGHGNVAALPERECSIQRRNQKVLEESPSVFIDPVTRKKMQEQAIQLAKAVGYQSAGTVEFLADKDKNFYFLEMNTRLQVEHPVSELVGGVDLVEQMIRVAAGHKLPDELLDPNRPILGWAHEARVYAEDPFRGFLPSTGRLITYEQPTLDDVESVRVDTGVSQGSEISMFYDPMISKLVTHGETREEALDRLGIALDNYVVQGLGHNLNFLREVTRHPKFIKGNITTKFIEEEYPDGFSGVKLEEDEAQKLALQTGLVFMRNLNNVVQISNQTTDAPIPDKLYITIKPFGTYVLIVDDDHGEQTNLIILQDTNGTPLGKFEIEGMIWEPGTVRAHTQIQGERLTAQVLETLPQGYKMQYMGAIHDVFVHNEKEYEYSKYMLEKPEIDVSQWLLSPMPGSLISVSVQEGDTVFPGQELAIVEAMKMQNILRAEKQSVVKKIHSQPGSTLAVDQEIIEFETA